MFQQQGIVKTCKTSEWKVLGRNVRQNNVEV